MKVYIPRSFQREAEREGVSEDDCKAAIEKVERGLIDAALAGGLVKQRRA